MTFEAICISISVKWCMSENTLFAYEPSVDYYCAIGQFLYPVISVEFLVQLIVFLLHIVEQCYVSLWICWV